MSLGYMTNAFGELVGSGGGVTSVKDIRYVTMCDDEDAIKKITEIGFGNIEIFDGNLSCYEENPEKFTEILKKYNAKLLGVYIGANYIYEDALEDELYRIEKLLCWCYKTYCLGGGAIRSSGIKDSDYELSKGVDKANDIVKDMGHCKLYHI